MSAVLLTSLDQLDELEGVLERKKFEVYMRKNERLDFLDLIIRASQPISVLSKLNECRDSNDNHLLALALDGRADILVTGDKDLLSLHPWNDIKILSPSGYLKSAQTQNLL